MSRELTVVPLFTVAFTGSTWITTVLGSHQDVFSIGPGIRILEDGDQLRCRLHHRDCPFWPPFLRRWRPEENFFLQIAGYSGKRILVVYNPRDAMIAQDFDPELMRIQPIKIVRDGRGTTTSYLGHNPDRFSSYYDSVNRWFRPGLERILELEVPGAEPALLHRYEDLVLTPRRTLQSIGDALGITYPDNALRFWEFDNHPVGGNGRFMNLMARLQQIRRPNAPRLAFYDEAFERLLAEPDKPIHDERWKETLTREDRFVFEYVCGDLHRQLGYESDVFSPEEADAFRERLGLPADPKDRPAALDAEVASGYGIAEQFRVI